jgi:hypothetical protein
MLIGFPRWRLLRCGLPVGVVDQFGEGQNAAQEASGMVFPEAP